MKQGINKKKRMAIIAVSALVVFALMYIIALKLGKKEDVPPGSSSWLDSRSSDSSSIAPFDRRNFTMLVAGIDDTLRLTDVLMVAKVNLDEKTAVVLQIPRDSYVGTDYATGKINAVYGSVRTGGINELRQVVESLLQLRLDFYTTITLEGFRNVIDSLGGIPIDIPYRIDYLPGQVIEPGEQTLSGQQAEWFVRYRAGYASGDLGRISAQELFLKALMQAVKDQGRIEAFKSVTKNYDNITTNLPMIQLLSLANEGFQISSENISFFLVPGSGVTSGGYAVYNVDAEGLAKILNENFRGEDEQIAAGELGVAVAKPDPPRASSSPSSSSSANPSTSEPDEFSEEDDEYLDPERAEGLEEIPYSQQDNPVDADASQGFIDTPYVANVQ